MSAQESSGPFRPEFSSPSRYFDWLAEFQARRERRIAALNEAVTRGDAEAAREFRLRSTNEREDTAPKPWAGPSESRLEDLGGHFDACEGLTGPQVRSLAHAWATDALDGFEPSFALAVNRANSSRSRSAGA